VTGPDAPAGTPPGWYPDPWRRGPWRWWDGHRWAADAPPADASAAPAGWHPDPWRVASWRWWDGGAWSGHTASPPRERPWFPPRRTGADARVGVRGGGLALVGFVAAEVAAIGIALALLAAGVSNHSLVLLVGSQAGLWAVLLTTCLVAVRRHGHGSLGELGLSRLRRHDVAVGLLAALIGRLATIVLVAPLIPLLPHRTVRSTPFTYRLTSGTLAAVVVAAIVAIGAPFFEELFFRGLVQSVFTRRYGPRVAVFAQAACFAVVHYQVGMGLVEILITFLSIGTFGVYLGVLRWRYDRLGPGMVAHAAFNLVAVVLVLAVN
jgi:hypothetical protein